jgi:hypothetical protein
MDPDGSAIDLNLGTLFPVTVLVLPEGETLETTGRLLRPHRAREEQRANRARSTSTDTLRIVVDGEEDVAVRSALNAIDDSPLSRRGGDVESLFVAGIEDGAPRFLEGSHLAELGVAALLSGRRSLARSTLEALCALTNPSALPLLHFAGRWAHWTGDPRFLLALRPALDRTILALDRSANSPSLPPPSRALRELIEGIEPLGDEEWNRSLRGQLERIEAGASPSRRRTLPVLGGGAPIGGNDPAHSGEPQSGERVPDLPHPSTFAAPDHPGVLARRTVQGARILRSWIEGTLGVRPDAGYGRIRIAPAIEPEWQSFEAGGITAGDARLSFRFRSEREGCEFILRQEGGKVPVNLIFEPLLPIDRVTKVWIDGEVAEVETESEEGGIRLRCQLPLDGERRIRIAGATSGTASLPS